MWRDADGTTAGEGQRFPYRNILEVHTVAQLELCFYMIISPGSLFRF